MNTETGLPSAARPSTRRDTDGLAAPFPPHAAAGLHSNVEEPAVQPPVPPVRGEALLARADRACTWLDGWLSRWLPPTLNPLAQAGAAANLALIVAVATGVALLLWYSPSVQFAYSSLASVNGRTPGGWVRAMHRYSSDLAMLLLVVHAGRVFVARKFSGARWLPWISGVAMLGLVWFIGWTGYWLVWDQPAQHVAVSSMGLLDGLPIFGEPLGRLYVSDRTVPSLLFFVVFFLHMLLPLAIAVGLAIHLARVSRARLLPVRTLSWALLAALAVAALVFPASLNGQAQMAVKAPGFVVDAWYLSPLAFALRFHEAGLWLALFGAMVLAGLVPWLLGRRRSAETFQARVNVSRCHACTQCMQDCPFDAISMVARTDGKPFPSQAQVDPARCVGCGVCAGSCDSEGIALTWFDTRIQEARLEREIERSVEQSGSAWIAFVAADIRSPLPALRGFDVHAVPTASWVRPKFLERLFAKSVAGALVVRDASAEAWARDGRQWVAARLLGERKPVLRPERAAGGVWSVVDFDASRPRELVRAAEEFRSGAAAGLRQPARSRRAVWISAAALASLAVAAAVAPSHLRVANPMSPEPELVLSFKALGERVAAGVIDPVADAAKPVHMRGRPTEKPHRRPVTIRLTVDGTTEERTFGAKGFSSDGPAVGEWRRALVPGEHAVAVEIASGTAAPQRWNGILKAETRRLHVIAYDAQGGFTVE